MEKGIALLNSLCGLLILFGWSFFIGSLIHMSDYPHWYLGTATGIALFIGYLKVKAITQEMIKEKNRLQ